MSLIDFILNLAGLLLWLSWRSLRFDPITKPTALSLLGTLKKANPSRWSHWKFPLALLALLLVRALGYWKIGPAVNWTPDLQLSVITLAFRSDFPGHMFLFSTLSFGLMLFHFFLWLVLVAAVNHRMSDDPLQKLVRLQLGFIDRCPWQFKWLLPLLGGALIWTLASQGFVWLGLVPAIPVVPELLEQATIIGIATYLAWKYLIAGLLLLHLFNSYVYLGEHPFWKFVNATAGNLIAPLRRLPLRWGKVDFSPAVGFVLVFLVAEFGQPWLTRLYQRIPF